MIVAWSGMRGSVSLAAALALPPDFPQRDVILLLTFAVIFSTLVLQGLTLPALIRRLDVHDDGADEREELARAPRLRGRRAWPPSTGWPRRTGPATTPPSGCAACTPTAAAGSRRGPARRTTATATRSARSRTRPWCGAVLDAQRAELVRLRNRGEISNEVMHRLERELDLEDERLEI